MEIQKKELATIQKNSLFLLSEPSGFARRFLYYMIGLGHFFTSDRYGESRQANAYDSFLLLYIIKGRLEIQTQHGLRQAGDGQIALLDCYEKHSYRSIVPTEFVYIHFDGNNSRAFYEEIVRSEDHVFTDPCFSSHRDTLLTLCTDIDTGKMPGEDEISVLIHRILCDLCKKSVAEYSFKYSAYIRKALSYIENNFTANISVTDIAVVCNLSTQHLNRLFRNATDLSPYQYILEKRMRYACTVLLNSECSIEETAYKAGFANPFNFMNSFKKSMGSLRADTEKNIFDKPTFRIFLYMAAAENSAAAHPFSHFTLTGQSYGLLWFFAIFPLCCKKLTLCFPWHR